MSSILHVLYLILQQDLNLQEKRKCICITSINFAFAFICCCPKYMNILVFICLFETVTLDIHGIAFFQKNGYGQFSVTQSSSHLDIPNFLKKNPTSSQRRYLMPQFLLLKWYLQGSFLHRCIFDLVVVSGNPFYH